MTERTCVACGDPLVQRPAEHRWNFAKRQTCGRACANRLRSPGPDYLVEDRGVIDDRPRPDANVPVGRGWRRRVLEIIAAQPGITIPELATDLQIPHNRLYKLLPAYERAGMLEKRGRGWWPR
jgi:hypothetical protein